MDEVRRIEHRIEHTERHVGQQIRARRIMLGLTQKQLAEKTGITYQQIQKFERRENRVPGGLLPCLARALEVTIGYFFEAADTEAPPRRSVAKERQLAALLQNFNSMPPYLKDPFANMTRALAA